jgi:AAA15 family ATPase/GTPase
MKIKTIKIKNFISIVNVNIDINDFNVFVGQNNHGKSNFLEAIEWFYNGSGDLDEIKRKCKTIKDVSVEICFLVFNQHFDKLLHNPLS